MSPLAFFPFDPGTGGTADIRVHGKTTGGRIAKMSAASGRLASASWTALLDAEAELALAAYAIPGEPIRCNLNLSRHPEE